MSEPGHPPPPGGGIKGEVMVEEPDRWQRAVARRSAESRATVPDLEVEVEARADAALAEAERLGCGLEALMARTCALALREHPEVNGAYRDGRFERYARVNVGVVIATPTIYVIPTLLDADRRPLAALAEELRDLRNRAAAGELSPPELSGATFTLWDAGALGLTRAVIPVVPPQAAALTAGAARPGTTVQDGRAVAP